MYIVPLNVYTLLAFTGRPISYVAQLALYNTYTRKIHEKFAECVCILLSIYNRQLIEKIHLLGLVTTETLAARLS